jgi:hypothetical protein
MPLNTAIYYVNYGTAWWYSATSTYCQNNTSASDYGKCYGIAYGKAIFVQTDTTTWPIDPSTGSDSFPCAKDGTCIRYTTIVEVRSFGTVFSYSGKQAIVQYFWSRSHAWASQFIGNIVLPYVGMLIPTNNGNPGSLWFLPSHNYEISSWPVYDPVANFKAYLNPYTIPSGYVAVLRWYGSFFTPVLYLSAYERIQNNIWYAADVRIMYAYESSPLAIIPLDYDRDYMPYQELRSAFGYAATGVDQPGWNADDIIRVLRELFPDRAWAVFDDRQYVLYLYNLTPDYVPDWLVEKLTPTAMKVLQPPADVAVAKAWLDLLNERNAQIPPQAELP